MQRTGKKWTAEEDQYLREAWGSFSFRSISNHLQRSVGGIRSRAGVLGLPPFLESGDYITLNQMRIALGYGRGGGYILESLVEKRGMPVRKIRRGKVSVRIIYLDEFWAWAEKNKSYLDFSKMEPLALGAEPDWVADQRHKDYLAFGIQRKDKWTPEEDSRLKMLISRYQYTWSEISVMLHRSEGAIQRRLTDLGIKGRPIKATNTGKGVAWSADQLQILTDGIKNGDSYALIAKAVGKSEKAVRGKVYTAYYTEDADNVRRMIGDGSFGDGKPVPLVKQARFYSPWRVPIKNDIEAIAGILQFVADRQAAELLKDDPYFQKNMCVKWDPYKAVCTAGCENCDACGEFERLRPQYCCRCGIDFLDRKPATFCPACRAARKKAAQQHWARVHSA